MPGKYVPIKETVRGFREILDGKCDDLPEQAFTMAGTIDDAREKAEKFPALLEWKLALCSRMIGNKNADPL